MTNKSIQLTITCLLSHCAGYFSLLFSIAAFALPNINQYDSYITVGSNSGLSVQEDINITTDESIQHGIYRDFPIQYRTPNGQMINIAFKVIDAELNHKPIEYRIESLGNGVRVYLGSKERYLPIGTYTFTINYTALGELGFFPEYDELYWNVTGNGWAYPIANARAVVQLPNGAAQQITSYVAYTGNLGSVEKNYRSYIANDNRIVFLTTQGLNPTQGLTIAVGWKKGFVSQPTFLQRLFSLEGFNSLLILALGALCSLYYCRRVWIQRKANLKTRIVIPEYEPPSGFTPSELRYILNRGFDFKVLTAAIINMAVKGYLKISQVNGSVPTQFLLIKQPTLPERLSESEEELGANLFEKSDELLLKQQSALLKTTHIYSKNLDTKCRGKYFSGHSKNVIGGMCVSSLAISLSVILNPKLMPTLWIIFGMGFFSFMVSPLENKLRFNIVRAGILIIPLILPILFAQRAIIQTFGMAAWIYYILLALIVGLQALTCIGVIRFTPEGEAIITHTKGFKLFLNATEKDRLNFRNPPNLTPELFEKYLSYALALGVEQKWSEQFSDILSKAHYQPSWYTGTSLVPFNRGEFARSVKTSLAHEVSSSNEAPGRSSGSSGGGSSGGGAGGGGGGGW